MDNPRIDDLQLAVVVGIEDQSATYNLQRARIYNAMILQFQNILPPPANMELLDYNPSTLLLSIGGALHHDTVHEATPGFTPHSEWRLGRYCGVWLAVVAVYLATCALLLAYTQLKFQSGSDSPFQTHLGFIILSLVALFMTLFTSGILFYTNNNLQSLMNNHFSPIYDVILKCVFCFSTILTPLSLLLLLFVPEEFNWLGYLIVCELFVAILACNFNNLRRLLAP